MVNALLSYLQQPVDQIKGAEAVRLSAPVASFSKEIFEDRSILYNLLQILVKTCQIPPLSDIENIQHDCREIIQQNILGPLQKASPHWFQEALAFLENEATFNGIVSFLAATGLIDAATQMDLTFQKDSSPNFEKIKTLLKNKMVATAETVSSNDKLEQMEIQIHANTWPEKRKISSSWDQLLLFNFIKRKLFFSEQPWDSVTLSLFFLSPEEFKEIAKTAQSVDRLPSFLAEELGLEKAKGETRRLYKHTFDYFVNAYGKDPLKGALYAAYSFFAEMKKVIAPSDMNPYIDADQFFGLCSLMNASNLSQKEITSFVTCFFNYHREQKRKKDQQASKNSSYDYELQKSNAALELWDTLFKTHISFTIPPLNPSLLTPYQKQIETLFAFSPINALEESL